MGVIRERVPEYDGLLSRTLWIGSRRPAYLQIGRSLHPGVEPLRPTNATFTGGFSLPSIHFSFARFQPFKQREFAFEGFDASTNNNPAAYAFWFRACCR